MSAASYRKILGHTKTLDIRIDRACHPTIQTAKVRMSESIEQKLCRTDDALKKCCATFQDALRSRESASMGFHEQVNLHLLYQRRGLITFFSLVIAHEGYCCTLENDTYNMFNLLWIGAAMLLVSVLYPASFNRQVTTRKESLKVLSSLDVPSVRISYSPRNAAELSLEKVTDIPFAKPVEESCFDGWTIRTEKELSAVVELRSRLTDIANECTQRPLDMSDVTLIRFIRARNLNLEKAESMYRDCLAWRKEKCPEKAWDEFETNRPNPELFEYTTGGWLPGFDKEGTPVFVDRIGELDVPGMLPKIAEEDFEQMIMWRQETNTRLMLKSEALYGKKQYQMVVITDLKGLSWSHKAGFPLMKCGAYIDDHMYPEQLKVAVVINAPRLFGMIWNIVKHFFDPNTRAKIQIHAGPATDVLLKYVDKENLPKYLGGELVVDGDEYCTKYIKAGGKVPNHIPLSPFKAAQIKI